MGETVDIGNNFFSDSVEAPNGYAIRVNSAELVSYEDLLTSCGVDPADLGFSAEIPLPQYTYMVNVTISNEENETGAIMALNYALYNQSLKIPVDYYLWGLMDKSFSGEPGFRLHTHSEKNITIPFTPMALIDMLSILPGLNIINQSFKLFRLTRLLKVIRLLKLTRYSRKIMMFLVVLKKERHVLFGVLLLAIFYIFLTALVMFNAEPHINPHTGEETFHSFFDALYWATVTLTTVGYGDLTPVTDVGRIVSMVSSLFGVAIIALPSGVITASYLEELRDLRLKKEEEKEIN